MNTLWMIVGCGVLAILYGIWATNSVLAADQGSKKMQEYLGGRRAKARRPISSASTPPSAFLSAR